MDIMHEIFKRANALRTEAVSLCRYLGEGVEILDPTPEQAAQWLLKLNELAAATEALNDATAAVEFKAPHQRFPYKAHAAGRPLAASA